MKTNRCHHQLFWLTAIIIVFSGQRAGALETLITPVSGDSSVVDTLIQATPAPSPVDTTKTIRQSFDEAIPRLNWVFAFRIFFGLLIFFTVYIFIKYMTRFMESVAELRPRWRMAIKGVIPVLRIIIWTFTVYMIIAGILPISSLLALSASAGIAVGFAAQDLLKNIFGGIMILSDRPFQVGDKIEVGHYYGEVIQIGLRTVRIVTRDDSVVSIPNGEIMNQAVSNANSGASDCQVVAEFFLPAHVNLVKARKIALEAAYVSRYVYLKKPVSVTFKNEIHEGRSMLKMRLKAYVLDIRYEFPFASEMTETVLTEFLQQEIVTKTDLDGVILSNLTDKK